MNEKVMRFENKRDNFFYNKKQKQKNMICNLKKPIFFIALLWLVLWLSISKMFCRALEGASITF
jgi:hypothetical protein